MASPHKIIADALGSVATAWVADNWSGVSVEVGYQIEKFMELLKDGGITVVGVLPTSVDDQSDRIARRHDEDLITVSVMVIGSLANVEPDTIEIHDEKTSDLREHLRGVFEIPVGNRLAERESTKLFTAYDHDSLSDEVWASLILCEYSLDSGVITEVLVP